MRHLLSAAAFASCLALAVATLDSLGRRSEQAGVIWVVTRGEAGPALASLPKGQDLRVLDVWMGGRVLQLHAPSLRRGQLPGHAVLATVRMPLQALALPGCG
jgi:hypothetical protein